MTNSAKPRQEHRGQPAPHLGHDHFEADRARRAAQAGNGDPTLEARSAVEGGSSPAKTDRAPVEPEVADAKADLDSENGVPRSG